MPPAALPRHRTARRCSPASKTRSSTSPTERSGPGASGRAGAARYDRHHARRRRLALLDRRVLVLIAVIPATVASWSAVYLRKTQAPRVRRRRVATVDRRSGRLGARRAGRGPGRRAGSPSPARTTPTRCSPTSTRSPPRPRSSWPQATGLRSLAGPARARVTDRAGWVRANVASFQRLLRPLTDKLGERIGSTPAGAAHPAVRRRRGRACCSAGCRPGCSASTTCCRRGRRDGPTTRTSSTTSGPNVLALEKRFAFPPREFRLWLALHEVTHRAQFTGVPWLREHFLGLVDQTLDSVDPDPKRFLDALRRVARRAAGTGATRSTTAASSRCSPPPSSGRCSRRSAG